MEREALFAWMEAGSRVAGLPIDPAWRDGVVLNLERLAAMAELVNGFEPDYEMLPAPRFEAQPPE